MPNLKEAMAGGAAVGVVKGASAAYALSGTAAAIEAGMLYTTGFALFSGIAICSLGVGATYLAVTAVGHIGKKIIGEDKAKVEGAEHVSEEEMKNVSQEQGLRDRSADSSVVTGQTK